MSQSQVINQFNPTTEETIVVNMQEFPSNINNFINYSVGFNVPHNSVPKQIRQARDIKFIVLHETSADTGGGFRAPNTAHFVVLRDGTIHQFNDLSEIEWHAGIFNDTGIGIEFVNRDWEDGRGIKKNTVPQNLSEDKGYLWAFWGDGYNIYKLPSIDQLERLVELLNRLLNKDEENFPFLEPIWLQYVSYNNFEDIWELTEELIPDTDNKKEALQFFVYSNAYSYMVPGGFDHLGSGILSHNSISNIKADGFTDEDAHTDGSFQALYSMLRINFDYTKEDAFEKAKDLFKNHKITASTKNNLKWLEQDPVTKQLVTKTGKRKVHLLDLSNI